MTLLWQSISAALLPIALRDVPKALERFLEHLQRHRSRHRERAAVLFNRHLREDFG
jgi:hypothetical protein